MTFRPFLGALVTAGSVVVAMQGGCGQSVATCATICALPDAPMGQCLSSCSGYQSCSAATGAADFQSYLTCVSNAGQYAAGDTGGLCAAEMNAVVADCDDMAPGSGSGTGTGTPTSSSSGVSTASFTATGSGTPTLFQGSCSALADCCGDLPAVDFAVCHQVSSQGDEDACDDELDALSAAGECTGGPEPVDAGAPSSDCATGAPCEGDSMCVNTGVGPCGSDQVLACEGGVYAFSVFSCDNQQSSCGFGIGGCSESCSCQNNEMICTGDCPDAGLSMP